MAKVATKGEPREVQPEFRVPFVLVGEGGS